eukprot:Sspe_Gene.49948::Locus_27348_Transcript_13_14_Confidence_0.221_Length_1404::g.49948::m.49948
MLYHRDGQLNAGTTSPHPHQPPLSHPPPISVLQKETPPSLAQKTPQQILQYVTPWLWLPPHVQSLTLREFMQVSPMPDSIADWAHILFIAPVLDAASQVWVQYAAFHMNTKTLLRANRLHLACGLAVGGDRQLSCLAYQSFAIFATTATTLTQNASIVYGVMKRGNRGAYIGESGYGGPTRAPCHLRTLLGARQPGIDSPAMYRKYRADGIPCFIPLATVDIMSPARRLLGRKLLEADITRSMGKYALNRALKSPTTSSIEHMGIATFLHSLPKGMVTELPPRFLTSGFSPSPNSLLQDLCRSHLMERERERKRPLIRK